MDVSFQLVWLNTKEHDHDRRVRVCLLFSRSVMSDSMGFPRHEYWSGLPFPFPGNLLDSGIEPLSPALAGGFSTIKSPGKPTVYIYNYSKTLYHFVGCTNTL